MTKKKTLEEYKQKLIGKRFDRLTVLDVQINYRKSNGQKNGFSVLCKCDYFTGDVYKNLNSVFKGLTNTHYYWAKNGRYFYSRQQCQ